MFTYQPCCAYAGCEAPARFKVAAGWSEGSLHELKTYALACPEHLEALREAAVARRSIVRLTEGESVEPIAVYDLRPPVRGAISPHGD